MIWEIYPVALDCGIAPIEFWEYSLDELQDYIQSYQRVKKQKIKENITFGYMIADLMIERYAATKDKKIKISSPWERYPDLFSEEKEIYEKAKAISDLEEYKTRRRKFAQQHNERMKNAPE